MEVKKIEEKIPNPQFYRDDTVLLNGTWDFFLKRANGEEAHTIEVPFCPESQRSGLALKGFIRECRYERKFFVRERKEDECVVLHFGAVDYQARVYVNGKFVGEHCGGYTPFSFDISAFVSVGENALEVCVYDDVSANLPSGKQASKMEESYGCFYTRVTGIWQSVWIEYRPKAYIVGLKIFPDAQNGFVDLETIVSAVGELEWTASYHGKTVATGKKEISYKNTVRITPSELHLWEVGKGELYDLTVRFGKDEVHSYFAIRSVRFEGMRFLLNGKSVFQRFVLAQGMYEKGVYTPANDEERLFDVRSAMRLGFNGIRLHQKVFDPRMLYLCDREGCMVWGEFPSWGIRYSDLEGLPNFLREWQECVERDFNHPSIVVWCPLNEVWKDWDDPQKSRDVRFIDEVYAQTKALDGTRPCVDVSGGFHGNATDLYDFHCYEEYEKVEAYLAELEKKDCLEIPLLYDEQETQLRYRAGLPTNISEYGGFRFSQSESNERVNTINECGIDCTESWGYGKGETDEKSFVERYCKLTKLLLSQPKLSGFCYTQLYDIEQEQNGFFTYARAPKLSAQAEMQIAECNRTIAEIEK